MNGALAVLIIALSGSGQSISGLAKRYLEGLFRAKPHLATFMGEHRFDGELPDFTPATLAARQKTLEQMQTVVRLYLATAGKAKAGDKQFPLDDRIDAEIIDDAVALELLYLRDI